MTTEREAESLAEIAFRLQAELNIALLDLSERSEDGRHEAVELARLRAEIESASAEGARLQSELDAALAERAHLQSELDAALASQQEERALLLRDLRG